MNLPREWTKHGKQAGNHDPCGVWQDRDQYLELVRQFPLRPLRTDADLDAAVAVVDALIDRSGLTKPEQDYLDVLSDLVEAYEAEMVPMKPVGDADLLRFLIEQKSVSQAEAASGAAIAESTISEVLAGKRKLNHAIAVRPHITKR
jgi:HTH-type transcriptional regulator / antitoxin HigA